jgi:hypothetical protein
MSTKTKRWIYTLISFAFAATLCSSCKEDNASQPVSLATDYSKVSHWLSVPAPVMAVDVFYLYPTCWTKTSSSAPNICDIDNASMLAGAPPEFARQATAFETFANVFAPFYRQADAGYTLGLTEDQREQVIGGIPTSDVTAAFEYYIQHYNEGRPFILAGHSQGSNVLIHLLSGYMKNNPAVYQRMIAAYVIGYPVTAAYLADNPHLKFAQGPDDVGVIISYNTQAPSVVPPNNPVVSTQVGLVINPLTWTRSETEATTAEGLGSLMPDSVTLNFQPVPQYADARIDLNKGVLVCSTADSNALYKYTSGFGMGVYHSFDYPFYYFNLRANAQNRANKFLGR